MIAYIFLALSALFLVAFFLSKRGGKPEQKVELKEVEIKEVPKTSYGRVRIYFGSQTGTAAKLAEQLAEQGTEQGFTPQVIDLKDLTVSHFDSTNEVSLFLLSNTGEGDPPENTVKFMKVLKGKQSLDEEKNVQWKKINYSIFGLGNTQYQHYNKTAIDADALLEKNGGKRIYKLGLGDDNCSLEDDFSEWRKQLWQALKGFRNNNPLKQAEQVEKAVRKISNEIQPFNYISKQEPIYANYKIFVNKDTYDYMWKMDDLDFKTKAALNVYMAQVKQVRELRQNTNDGSTLEIQLEIPGQPQYQTAGNIALFGSNDPKIVEEIISYFKIPSEILEEPFGLTRISEEKKVKLNFLPINIKTLLTEHIDIQGKLSKSVLRKLAKFESKNPNYFTENSLKTTKEFERLTDEKEWYYLIRLIKEFQVKLTFEDFIDLSDSMAPRLFTIASHAKTQKNVIIAASIVEKGLISKFFLNKPEVMRVELRKSTFTDAMQWKKVIFIATGTGFAPFRAYIQEKIYNIRQKEQGNNVNVPIITLFFGIKHEHGDFIYKEEILRWKEEGIINRLHLALSRDTDKKVYVQDLLKRQEEELKQLGHCQDTAIYICGSLPMGKSIVEVLSESFGAEKVKEMEEKGRIVKELW